MEFKSEDKATKTGYFTYDVWVHNVHGQLDRVADTFWSHNRQDWICPITQDTFTELGYTFICYTDEPERPSEDLVQSLLGEIQRTEKANEMYDGMVM